ncbi:DNA adenine methylase [Porticoccus sp.]|uniref:DNA adenine methylase n=1 Tax=Porticoccus sp. TaxID=2024853 RepID=UPI000C4C5A65|nr:DNA adenine methylase [Porticoccus sp.]MAZ71227.1 adenine methyltransferase [Porticoccus sp.]
MAEPYSPLRYPGGKAKITDFLAKVIELNDISDPHYVEPYAGGAGAALSLLVQEYVESITINDADPRIYSFWRAITEHNDNFIERLESIDVSVDEWHRQRKIYQDGNVTKFFELGFATFYLNRTARSGIIHNGGPIGGYDQKGNYKIDARFNRTALVRRIRRIGVYADRIDVSSADGLSLLKTINKSPIRAAGAFVYLDPPYYVKGGDLYLNTFTHTQHKRLAEYLRNSKRFPWIMTYDNVEAIRSLYREFNQTPFDLSYSAYESRKGQEILIHPDCISVPQSALNLLPKVA